MKKQIFILFLAIFAVSFSSAYGQLVCPTPRPVDATCLANDALHPIPGTLYNYSISVPTPPGTKEYTWLVTQDQNFIVSPGTLTANREAAGGNFLAATGTGYNDPLTGTASLALTWKSFTYDQTKPVFVVIQVKNSDITAGACLVNNLKVFKVVPVNAFTLDIANLGADKTTVAAYETSINRCISPIVAATYDATAPEGVVYNYGVDYLYYVVTAANFSTSWLPSFKITAIDPKETVKAVEWFKSSDAAFATPVAMTFATGVYTSVSPVPVTNASGTVGSAGECIVIRLTIDHTNKYEGITDETITVAVDGKTQLAATTPIGDIHFSKTVGVAADCGIEDGFDNDIATQILKARPDIQSTTPTSAGPNATFLPAK